MTGVPHSGCADRACLDRYARRQASLLDNRYTEADTTLVTLSDTPRRISGCEAARPSALISDLCRLKRARVVFWGHALTRMVPDCKADIGATKVTRWLKSPWC